jgi:hypothetical protein
MASILYMALYLAVPTGLATLALLTVGLPRKKRQNR